MAPPRNRRTDRNDAHTDGRRDPSRRRVLRAGAGFLAAAVGVGRVGAASDSSDESASDYRYSRSRMEGNSVRDSYSQFRGGNGAENWALDEGHAASGQQSLRGRIDAGDSWASNAEWNLAAEGYAANVDEIHHRVQFRLDEGFAMESDQNCRIFNTALADGSANSGGGGTPSGEDGWSERLYVTESGTRGDGTWNLLSYTYHMDQGGQYGDQSVLKDVGLTAGEWHQIDTYVRVNSYSGGSASSDGVVRYWLNDDLVHERTDLRFTTSDDNRIQWGGPVLHYGGGYDAPSDVLVWYDDHQIWVDSAGPQ